MPHPNGRRPPPPPRHSGRGAPPPGSHSSSGKGACDRIGLAIVLPILAVIAVFDFFTALFRRGEAGGTWGKDGGAGCAVAAFAFVSLPIGLVVALAANVWGH